MAIIQNAELEKIILNKYNLAKQNVGGILKEVKEFSQNISNNIPTYDINEMKFGVYKEDHFVSLFADMRGSTERAKDIGPIETFLTIHAIMPTMIYVVQAYGGRIVDLPGDGVMALFKGNPENIYWENSEEYLNEETLAVKSGEALLKAFKEVVNPILATDEIDPVEFGVGIDTGKVIVTKVGTDKIRDIKAIGDCINASAKKANGDNEIFISNTTYDAIPSFLQISFTESDKYEGWFSKKIV